MKKKYTFDSYIYKKYIFIVRLVITGVQNKNFMIAVILFARTLIIIKLYKIKIL